jgi:hypothetical protein
MSVVPSKKAADSSDDEKPVKKEKKSKEDKKEKKKDKKKKADSDSEEDEKPKKDKKVRTCPTCRLQPPTDKRRVPEIRVFRGAADISYYLSNAVCAFGTCRRRSDRPTRQSLLRQAERRSDRPTTNNNPTPSHVHSVFSV